MTVRRSIALVMALSCPPMVVYVLPLQGAPLEPTVAPAGGQPDSNQPRVDEQAEKKAAIEPKPVTPAGVVERKSSKASRAKGEINFDDLKFDIEKDAPFKDAMLTNDLRSLNNKKVKLRGYILPSSVWKEKNFEQFVLVRDNQECCFGPGAALFDCVMVEMVPGKTADFFTRPVTVEGKFKIDTQKYKYPPGVGPRGATHLAIFRIEGVAVR